MRREVPEKCYMCSGCWMRTGTVLKRFVQIDMDPELRILLPRQGRSAKGSAIEVLHMNMRIGTVAHIPLKANHGE